MCKMRSTIDQVHGVAMRVEERMHLQCMYIRIYCALSMHVCVYMYLRDCVRVCVDTHMRI